MAPISDFNALVWSEVSLLADPPVQPGNSSRGADLERHFSSPDPDGDGSPSADALARTSSQGKGSECH